MIRHSVRLLHCQRRSTCPGLQEQSTGRSSGRLRSPAEENEHGEFVRGTIGDAKETYALITYGRVFGDHPRGGGQRRSPRVHPHPGAIRSSRPRRRKTTLSGRCSTANAAMGDGTALFHANHGNLKASARRDQRLRRWARPGQAMRKQNGLDGGLINVMARFLIVPPELETAAEQFLSATWYPSANNYGHPESLRRSLRLIVEPRLDARRCQ